LAPLRPKTGRRRLRFGVARTISAPYLSLIAARLSSNRHGDPHERIQQKRDRMPQPFEFGLDTFGDVTVGPDGQMRSHAQVIRDVVDEGVLADEVGVDAFGVGEHHRPDFSVSAPEVVLAAIGARTKRIRLGSAVTVLSSDDPIRVFERFSTVNAITNGRAEVTLGRGSFIESFPLFG
jgi:hypothetical protein